jgi:hypothetical protein
MVEGWHAPAGRRTREPRPLAQARQIRPAAPVGARTGTRPTDRSQDNLNGVGRIGVRPGPRPRRYARTTAKPWKQGAVSEPSPLTLPAEYLRLTIGPPQRCTCVQNAQFWRCVTSHLAYQGTRVVAIQGTELPACEKAARRHRGQGTRSSRFRVAAGQCRRHHLGADVAGADRLPRPGRPPQTASTAGCAGTLVANTHLA